MEEEGRVRVVRSRSVRARKRLHTREMGSRWRWWSRQRSTASQHSSGRSSHGLAAAISISSVFSGDSPHHLESRPRMGEKVLRMFGFDFCRYVSMVDGSHVRFGLKFEN